MTPDCLAESTVLAFVGGTLPPETLPAVEDHLAACTACAELVTWAAADQDSAVRLPGFEGRPFVGRLQPGARIDRYQILGALGRGAMGEVYAAYHPDLDRRIAVKVVYGTEASEAADGGEATNDVPDHRRGRLLREARAIARLSHPNVIAVHDAGTFGDGVFIAMELIDGGTIEQWLRAERRTWQEIVDVFIAAARGLAAAHAAGIIHRDFKPKNVMIAKDGSVRVMDFGLAQLAQADTDDNPDGNGAVRMTPAGAFVGTPAYMAPEQFRQEPADARTDQFSFCVALHEALFGVRPNVAASRAAAARVERIERSGPARRRGTLPVVAAPDAREEPAEQSGPTRLGGVPGWLRAIVLRGASTERERRYPSMSALGAALERGRTRVRRRLSLAAVVLASISLAASAWRIARGSRFDCGVPRDRISEAWAADDASSPRRKSIHKAFTASGRATAETSWERLAKVLDDHVAAWGAMYMETCEATHVRGEQSAEVLDLRMTCLNDNLGQVRALTDALVTADATVVPRAVLAAAELTPVSRCADVALLKSAVPLPRDERTLREVQRLRLELAEIEATREVGRPHQALQRLTALAPFVEKVGFRPLLGEQLEELGVIQSQLHVREAEQTLEEALFAAEAARDDATAAKAAAMLIYVVGLDLGRIADAERWARLAGSILDRMPPGPSRARSWVANNMAAVYAQNGRLEQAEKLERQAIALKEESVGPEHPDAAISLDGLGAILTELGRPAEGIAFSDRAIAILSKHADPTDPVLADAIANKATALLALGQHEQALASFERAIAMFSKEADPWSPRLGCALSGIGRTKLALGRHHAAIEPLTRANGIYDRFPGAGTAAAETQLALARALWDGGGDRQRARRLAESARDICVKLELPERAALAERWLASHTVGERK